MITYLELLIMLLGTTIIGLFAGIYIGKKKYGKSQDNFIKMHRRKVG